MRIELPRLSKGAAVIQLMEGLGVEKDVHAGATVRHIYSARKYPGRPNLRQVHLVAAELYDRLIYQGFPVQPGDLGENMVTRGIDLMALPLGARICFPDGASLAVTGLREPCVKIDRFIQGLRRAVTPVMTRGIVRSRTPSWQLSSEQAR